MKNFYKKIFVGLAAGAIIVTGSTMLLDTANAAKARLIVFVFIVIISFQIFYICFSVANTAANIIDIKLYICRRLTTADNLSFN